MDNEIIKQLEVINSVIGSADEMLYLLENHNTVDDKIYTTISDILDFYQKVVHGLPEILMTEHNGAINKNSLTNTYDKMVDSWDDFIIDKKTFYTLWEDFKIKWEVYYKSIKKIDRSPKTIYLSMN
ncbi:MAG: hypothetical protein ACLFR2_11710 [Candidatus Kapaibacterium sp.]